jgi:putative SOS response-associated peptidase YedK
MCNDYAREIEMGRVIAAMEEMKGIPPFSYTGGRIPNDAAPTQHIKIRDKGMVIRLHEDRLEGEMMTWAWLQGKKPVFNFVSEGREFSNTDRCLILATSFYEYTAPEERKPKIKLQDQHQFSLKGEEWFWIAGIVKQDCFAMLTAAPGPDIKPFHDRQIVVLRPDAGMEWLQLSKPGSVLLKALPKGSLVHKHLRKNGVEASH